MEKRDVVIVGAGAAGVGIACMLKDLGLENMLIIERDKVGSTFEKWPDEMRFITPSFTTILGTYRFILTCGRLHILLKQEHPTGKYAKYLKLISDHFGYLSKKHYVEKLNISMKLLLSKLKMVNQLVTIFHWAAVNSIYEQTSFSGSNYVSQQSSRNLEKY